MNNNQTKHLSFEERVIIEDSLNQGISVYQIAKKLNRCHTTIAREIKRNRYTNNDASVVVCDGIFGSFNCRKKLSPKQCPWCIETGNNCTRSFCRDCSIVCNNMKCEDFKPFVCTYLKSAPYVCNGCNTSKKNCRKAFTIKYYYRARIAQEQYEETLKDSRKGISISSEDMKKLDDLVSPLLINGQSLNAIYATHKDEIPCSMTTLYEYINKSYLTARNLDLPRKVRYKVRYNHGPRPQSLQNFAIGRTYKDFNCFLESNPDANIWEMDTVIGTEGGKCLLTLLFRKTNLMIAYLLDSHTQEAVIEALNALCDIIGIKSFQKYFQAILTDRGTEFGNPYAIECDRYGEIKTKLFYCDSYCSWQKGKIEKNHEFIRMILPKGKTFDMLTQQDVNLMMNHINNYPRENLNGSTPFELSKLLLGKGFLQDIHYHKIRPDDVILRERLLAARYGLNKSLL